MRIKLPSGALQKEKGLENGAIIGDRGGRGGGAVVCERLAGWLLYVPATG